MTPSDLLRAPARWRLGTRFALLSLALLMAVQLAGFALIGDAIERNARGSLAQELAVGERVWQRLLAQRATQFSQSASLLAADYGFREAIHSGDRETLVSALDNHGARIGAALVVWLDPGLRLRAQSSDADGLLLPMLTRLGPQLARSGQAMADVTGRPVQFVMVPVRAPLLIGWVVMGFALDTRLLDELHAISGVHGLLRGRQADGRIQLLGSSLPAGGSAARTLAPLPAQAVQARLDDAPYQLRRVAVAADGEATIDLWLARSVAEAVAPYRALQAMLLGLTAAGLLLSTLGSLWAARRVTRPLATLVQATERLGAGDLHTPVQETAPGEVGELATAFEQMRRRLAEQHEAVQRAAWWDRLTGLPNREQFRAAIAQRIAETRPHAVVMLDLDRFKHINDVLGHAAGDRVLCAVGSRLRDAVRPEDMVARLGGDEFALLLPDIDAHTVRALAERVTQAFDGPLDVDAQRVDLSAGLGLACWPAHATDADALLGRAEVAMYAAKRHTAGAELWGPQLETASAQNLSLLSDLRRAIELDELRLYLQPKVRLADGRLIGAEGLVRWQHPQRGLVPPMQFIPYAEQTGFIRELTLWVFDEGARLQAELAALGIERLSVNLSTRDLMDSDLPERLEAILRRRNARAEAFCLEITESAIMDDPQRAEQVLNRLAGRGYKLSIDDFGTGYSSLGYLRRLPVRELKIDRSFVSGLDRQAADQAIVKGTIDLAHNLGLSVVAEGVENAATVERLRALGCDEGQGYHYSRPVPLDELRRWAATDRDAAPAPAPLATTP
ncbi:putative bifunctional diguanylate cyclase/phosphodiesterase [Pseudaquabacterium rugosum]|uniref:EAL domain-containing protein n=1 Tax=Pseudaquabacterium rugosum TaxID=2984194 RepID=A0ABU9BB49_9BURK